VAVRVGDRTLFTLLDADLDAEDHLALGPASERALRRVKMAIEARRSQSDPTLWLRGGAVAFGVALAWVLVWWSAGRTQHRIDALEDPDAGPAASTYLRVLLLLACRRPPGRWRRRCVSSAWCCCSRPFPGPRPGATA
jgi:hypothetical protein